VLLGASLFGAACISILLTWVPGGIALFWPGSAIAGGVLIHLSRVRGIAATLSVFLSMPPIAVGLGSDARRAAARNLRISERRFRESMTHSPIGQLIAELDGKWTYTNLALQKMLGYSEAEFRAMPPHNHPECGQ
jgi:PAS domain-containing protein